MIELLHRNWVDQLWHHVVTHPSPLCPHQQTTVANIRSTGAKVAGRQKAFSSNGWFSILSQFYALWVTKTRVSMVHSPKTKTETKTRGFQDQDKDSEVPRPRLRGSRPSPRPRLVKTGLETSRDQDSSLENSKSAVTLLMITKQQKSV